MTEIRGTLVLDAPGGAFRIRARADRIEIGRDGRLGIVDYKTGYACPATPTWPPAFRRS